MFYFFNNPRSTFQDNYVVLLCLVYAVTGMAYIFAILLEPSPAQLVTPIHVIDQLIKYTITVTLLISFYLTRYFSFLLQCSVLLPVVLTLIANQDKDSLTLKYFGDVCYPKWALEAFVIANAKRLFTLSLLPSSSWDYLHYTSYP